MIASGYRKYSTGAEKEIIFDKPMLDTRSENAVNTMAQLR